jgi:twinkle protein
VEIREIVARMNESVEQIAKYLLPNGRANGREWCVGSINGEAGGSMKVCISGGKVGVWSDFASGQAGDLLDLWRIVRGHGNNKSALVEVKDYLGIQDNNPFTTTKQKEYRRPARPANVQKVQCESKVMEYLTAERKLTLATIAQYQIAEAAGVGPWEGWKKQEPYQGPWIVFPYKRDNELVSIKYLHLLRKGDKKITLVEKDCEPVCFGWHALDANSRTVTICEGELDAASLWQYGFPALSVPFGGGKGDKQQWVDSDWKHLEQFETIYLCMDDDKEGQAATEELVGRLGIHRCSIVTLPYKDANECLQKGVEPSVIAQCFAEARHIEPDELKRASHYTADVTKEFFPDGGKLPGFDAPWDKVNFRFLRGEVTVVAGMNGHGKSLLWGQVILSAGMQGERSCVASMEMSPRKTLYRMVRQSTGKRIPSREVIAECLEWLSDKVWLFDLVGTAKVERMLKVFEYAYRRYGIKQFVVDSLMKCGIAEDDYKGQKAFVEQLCDFASRTGAHVYLIAHMRKGETELTPGGKFDVKGTGAITDLAFNVFTVYRNKRKEQVMKAIADGETPKLGHGESAEEVRTAPDAFLVCEKSRNIEEAEGRHALWFDLPSMQYLERQGQRLQGYFNSRVAEDEPCPF